MSPAELAPVRKYVCAALFAVGQVSSASLFAQALPDGFFPESIAATSSGRVFVGSHTESRIVEIPAGAGAWKPFVASGANGLMSVQGLLADDARGILWVCTADLGVSGTAKEPSALLAFRIENGDDAGRWPLPDGGFCNDLAFASNRNLLITDTTHDRIFSFDLDEKRMSTWIRHPMLGGQPFNGNGIAVDCGNVFVSTFADGRLLRIPVESDGSAGEPVVVSLPRPLKGGDAIRAIGQDRLVIFENGLPQGGGQVTLALIENDRAILAPVTSALDEPTSGIVLGNRLLIVESQFARLYGGRKGAKPGSFSIHSVALDALPSAIPLPDGPRYPNGIAVREDGTIYIGFVSSGLIFRRPPGRGWEIFRPDSNDIHSGTALRLDVERDLLWGASPDFLVDDGRKPRPNRIFALDAKNGVSSRVIDLPDGSLGNDIAIEPDGAVLLTDSLRGRVLRLEPAAARFTVQSDDREFRPPPGETIGASGIARASDGRLIVANYGAGRLLAIELDGAVRPLRLPRPLANPDGLAFTSDGALIVCEGDAKGGNGRVLRIADPFARADRRIEILAEGLESPVNLSYLPGRAILVTEAKIRHRLISSGKMQAPTAFRIIKLPVMH